MRNALIIALGILGILALIGLYDQAKENSVSNDQVTVSTGSVAVAKTSREYTNITDYGIACVDGWEVRILSKRAIYARDDKFQPIPCEVRQ